MKSKTGFKCNGVVLISAPCSSEKGVSRRLIEDFEHIASSSDDFGFEHHFVSNKADLITLLESFKPKILKGLRPILHFDLHGCRTAGLKIADSNEYLDWNSLNNKLRELNIASKNNLVIFLAACHGFHLTETLEILKPCPYYILFSTKELVTIAELESSVIPFYNQLLLKRNVNEALPLLPEQFEYFNSEKVYLLGFANYIKSQCQGKSGKKRRERLLTELLTNGDIPNTHSNRKLFRTEIKNELKPDQEIMDRFAKIFLHGNTCSTSYETLYKTICSVSNKQVL